MKASDEYDAETVKNIQYKFNRLMIQDSRFLPTTK
jgi:hypothetical protein